MVNSYTRTGFGCLVVSFNFCSVKILVNICLHLRVGGEWGVCPGTFCRNLRDKFSMGLKLKWGVTLQKLVIV